MHSPKPVLTVAQRREAEIAQLQKATFPLLTSDKEEKNYICHSTNKFPVRGGKLRICTLHNPSEILCRIAPPICPKMCAVVCFGQLERSYSLIKKRWIKYVLLCLTQTPVVLEAPCGQLRRCGTVAVEAPYGSCGGPVCPFYCQTATKSHA